MGRVRRLSNVSSHICQSRLLSLRFALLCCSYLLVIINYPIYLYAKECNYLIHLLYIIFISRVLSRFYIFKEQVIIKKDRHKCSQV